MKALFVILGGGLFAAILAAAAKSSASTIPKTTPSSSGKITPSSSGKTAPGMTGQGGARSTPAYLSSVPYVIAMRVIEMAQSDSGAAQSQAVWLNANGWPLTADAVSRFLFGEIDQAELRRIAVNEWESSATKPKVKGTQAADAYGSHLLERGTTDEVFSYASTSNSIPFVTAAAAKLAAAGDMRALQITQHLADIR